MSAMSDLAFTDAVKAAQIRHGTRDQCVAYEQAGRPAEITEDLAAYVESRDSAYLATATAAGRPYIQHRGGAPGFIKVLDPHTLGLADYPGNLQLITTGNLSENDQAFLFLMDYPTQQRVKLWGRAEIVDDKDFVSRVADDGLPFTPERAVRFTVEAWDINCRKFIRQRFDEDAVRRATEKLTGRIAELERELSLLRNGTEV
jgi:hypothetical protein